MLKLGAGGGGDSLQTIFYYFELKFKILSKFDKILLCKKNISKVREKKMRLQNVGAKSPPPPCTVLAATKNVMFYVFSKMTDTLDGLVKLDNGWSSVLLIGMSTS